MSADAKKYLAMILKHNKIAVLRDFATTQKYYEFPTKSMDKRANAYEKALCKSVTKLHRF